MKVYLLGRLRHARGTFMQKSGRTTCEYNFSKEKNAPKGMICRAVQVCD
ncbi:hypothetical protein VPUCM_0616 [Vibrio parahaemolyticus UCM-V493]|nr:hypothetical protein VPUCM_0616 [Vibrio parahaemolyticus UCM-V493]